MTTTQHTDQAPRGRLVEITPETGNRPPVIKLPPFKSVDWSYPTSTNAKRFGFPNGCWTASRSTPAKDSYGRDYYEVKAVKAFETKEEAVAFALTMPERWSSSFLAYNPQYRVA